MPMALSWRMSMVEPEGAIGDSGARLSNDEARLISKLIARLLELVELERDRNKARSRQQTATAPSQAGDDR
jgi:hypothetical protein